MGKQITLEQFKRIKQSLYRGSRPKSIAKTRHISERTIYRIKRSKNYAGYKLAIAQETYDSKHKYTSTPERFGEPATPDSTFTLAKDKAWDKPVTRDHSVLKHVIWGAVLVLIGFIVGHAL